MLATVHDQRGRLVAMSSEFAECVGVEPDDVIGGSPPFPWWPKQDGPARALFDLLISEAGARFEGLEVLAGLRTQAGDMERFLVSPRRLSGGSTAFYVEPHAPRQLVRAAIELGQLAQRLESGESAARPSDALAELSSRERTVVERLLRGDRAARIARDLHISIHTARNHRKAIFSKLGVRSQVELIAKFGPRPAR